MSYKDRYFNQSMRIKNRINDTKYNCALDLYLNYVEDGIGGETELVKARTLLKEVLYGVGGTRDASTFGADRRNPDAISLLREVNIVLRNDFGNNDSDC